MATRPYLNVGAGDRYSLEWENIDLYGTDNVRRHDLRKPLPYADATFDAVYGSHVLEHLAPEQGASLLAEIHRVLRPRGLVRIAVPDLERLCREYLAQLEAADSTGDRAAVRRYRWIQVELLDQMVRTRPGGAMGRILSDGDYEREYVEARVGTELLETVAATDSTSRSWGATVRALSTRDLVPRLIGEFKRRVLSPQATGEAHKWMYDRFSLRLGLEAAGFVEFAVRRFDDSAIPAWPRYRLDEESGASRPRKPDSIYVEAAKAASI